MRSQSVYGECLSTNLLANRDSRGVVFEAFLPARWTAPDGACQDVPFSFEAENSETGRMFTTLGKGGEHFDGLYVREKLLQFIQRPSRLVRTPAF